MRITLIHQYFILTSSNGGTRSYETARRLVELGHEVNVVTSRGSGKQRSGWSNSSERGVQVHWFPVRYNNKMGFARRMLAFLKFAGVATRKAVQIETDLIFAMSTPLTIAIPGVIASRAKKVPLVFEVGDLWPEVPIAMGIIKHPLAKFLARSLEKWAYFNSSAVVTLSPQMKDGVVAAGFPATNVAVIPNACDFELFSPSQEGAEKFFRSRPYMKGHPVVLYPGTFGAVNGVGYAVDLAKELLAVGSDVIFLLVGEGKEKKRVREYASSAGVLGVNLFIENGVPKTQVVDMFSAATCIANLVAPIPALSANSANKFFDALAAGKPVLLNFNGWMTAIINERKCGIDTSALKLRQAAELVDSRLHDSRWLVSSQAGARVVAHEHFSRQKLVLDLDEVLRVVLSGEPHLSEAIAPGNYLRPATGP